jgi:hypothetical protein
MVPMAGHTYSRIIFPAEIIVTVQEEEVDSEW